jgi:hypothetical protein
MADLTEQQLLSTDPEVLGLQRQRQLANLLTGQAFNQPQGQMISGHYVKPSGLQQALPMINAAIGGLTNANLDEKQLALAEALRGKSTNEMNEYARLIKVNPDAAAEFARNAKTPEVRALGIKSLTPEEYTLSPGQVRFKGGQAINTAAPEPKLHVVKGNLVNEQGKVVYAAPVTAEEKANPAEAGLRSSFLNQATPHIQISQAYRKIETAPDTAAGDMSKIFGFMKILDPGSTVREGEYASAENARGVPDTVKAQYNKVISGQRLTPTQRTQFTQAAGDIVNSQKQQFEGQKKYYSDIAAKSRIAPESIIYDPYEGLNLQTTPQKQVKPVANINQQLGVPQATGGWNILSVNPSK